MGQPRTPGVFASHYCERVLYALLVAVILAVLTGCTDFGVTVRQDGSTVRHYLGYVRVISPPHSSDDGNFSVMEVSTVGLRFCSGFGLGYSHERNEYIPLDSRFVVRVANKEQLDRVIETLTPIVKEGLCVTVE